MYLMHCDLYTSIFKVYKYMYRNSVECLIRDILLKIVTRYFQYCAELSISDTFHACYYMGCLELGGWG